MSSRPYRRDGAELCPRPKAGEDLPPHNALRFCHITPEVNGCAVPLHGQPSGYPLR